MTEKIICKSCGSELTAMNLLSDPPIPVYICRGCGKQFHQSEMDKKEEALSATIRDSLAPSDII